MFAKSAWISATLLPAQAGHPEHAFAPLASMRHGIARWHTQNSGSANGRFALPRLKESGTALIFALVMLLLLTILGITAVTTSSLQEKMAGNMRDQYMAQQAGDSIILDGISWIFNQTDKPTPACPPAAGPAGNIWLSDCMPAAVASAVGAPAGANWWLTANDAWWTGNGLTSSVPTNFANSYVSQEPRYVVEKIRQVDEAPELSTPKKYVFYFRTTGWSVGASEYARDLFQSVFTKRSDTYTN